MGQILVRKVDDAILAKIKMRAKANQRSAEAEVREILSAAVAPTGRKRKPLASLIGAGRPGRSQAEIDAYVRGLRDEWNK
jgi:plasmid stability protein